MLFWNNIDLSIMYLINIWYKIMNMIQLMLSEFLKSILFSEFFIADQNVSELMQHDWKNESELYLNINLMKNILKWLQKNDCNLNISSKQQQKKCRLILNLMMQFKNWTLVNFFDTQNILKLKFQWSYSSSYHQLKCLLAKQMSCW